MVLANEAGGGKTGRSVRPAAILPALVLGAALALAPSPSHGAVDIGSTKIVVNNVYGNTLNRRMRTGENVIADQKIRTGVRSATNIALKDDTTLSIGERSELILDSLVYDPDRNAVDGAVDMVKGVLRFVSASARLDLSIKTKHALIGIRGTEFDVYVTPRATEIAVYKGLVQVESRFGTELVAPGQVYRVSANRGATFEERVSAKMSRAVSSMLALVAPESGDTAESTAAHRSASAPPELKQAIAGKDPENLVYLDLEYGRLVIELRPDLAPTHVARIKELTREKFYDGLSFHNVVSDFAAETGDPTGTGAGGFGELLAAEISDESFVRGTVGMKHKRNAPDTADSQFFILLGPAPHLDGQYTIWGRVIYGMQFTEQIRRGSPPKTPDKILSMRVAADVAD